MAQTISEDALHILQENYIFAKEIKELQVPLTKPEITHLRRLIVAYIGDGYSNYLRLVSIYTLDRDKYLNIYVRNLYNQLLNYEEFQL